MARVVGATPAQLREAGREDAADELERSVPVNTAALPKHGVQRLRDTWVVDDRPPVEPTSPRTSHDPHFDRAERLLGHAHASVRRGDHLGAINALEGVWSTVELLVDRITDEALLQGDENAEQSADTPEAAQPHAPGEADQEREVDDSRDRDRRKLDEEVAERARKENVSLDEARRRVAADAQEALKRLTGYYDTGVGTHPYRPPSPGGDRLCGDDESVQPSQSEYALVQRKLELGQQRAHPEQGEADGEESQVDPQETE
ncbi:hypothetical protein [Mycobacterium marinum]|nr:hypothetical protein [Mycobacterium marinum]